MNHDEWRAALELATSQDPGEAVTATYVVRGISLSESSVSRVVLEARLANRVANDVRKHARALLSREFLPYDPAYQLASNQVVVDEIDSVPALRKLVATATNDDVPTDSAGEVPIVAMIHLLHTEEPDEPIIAVRLKGPGIAVRRARGALALVAHRGVFEEVDEEILYYEPRFDVLVWRGMLVVSTITLLSRQLDSPQRAQKMARETFARATAQIAIEGAKALEDAIIGDPAMIAKMMSIARLLDADPGYAQLLTTERLVEFVRSNPEVAVDVVSSGGQMALVYDQHPQRRYRIPKMIADDYLKSLLSDRFYEAGSKQRL